MQLKVVITGSNGLLGQNLIALLLNEKEKYKTFGFSRGDNRSGRSDFEYHDIDITDKKLLKETLLRNSAKFYYQYRCNDKC